jgi:hypothetical protein
LRIVPVPVPSPIVAFPDGFERTTEDVSSGSGTVSPEISIWMTCEFWPCSNVSVPELAP